MTIALLIALLFAFIALDVPIAFAMGAAAIAVIAVAGSVPMVMVPHRIVMSTDSFTLLAIPLFVLAGSLMETGGIAGKLVNLAKALVGFVRGGLGMVVIICGGLLFGVATATEVASFAVVYALIVGFFVYKELTLAKLWQTAVDASVLSGVILLLLGLSLVYTYLMAIPVSYTHLTLP